MEWQRFPNPNNPLDPHGLGDFLRRLQDTVAPNQEPLGGFTFLNDSREMLSFSRQIERTLVNTAESGTLYVGFQNAGKLAPESDRYYRLRQNGVTVVAFGEDEPSEHDIHSVDSWTRLSRAVPRLENQWYLISTEPDPIVFVGWEVSAEQIFGVGGLTHPGKEFAGFVSDDLRVVKALAAYLEEVKSSGESTHSSSPDTVSAVIARLRPRRVLAFTDAGRLDLLHRSHAAVIAGCRNSGAELVLYDLSAASLLVNPYPDSDPERWPSSRRDLLAVDRTNRLDTATVRGLGRDYLAEQLESVKAHGVAATAILPYGVGFAHAGLWAQAEDIDLVVLPVEFTRPTLLQRLQGLTLDKLRESSQVQVVVDDPERGAWVARAVRPLPPNVRRALGAA